jgi:microcystin-dependent protein
MATVTPGYTFTNDEVVTPAKLFALAIPTVSVADNEITNAKLASDIDASKLTTGTLPIARIENGAVTLEKLVSSVQQALLPAGAVQAFAMNSSPSGWLEANGSNVSRTTYAALFSAIGTTYGTGDGSTTFTLPDLRGYFVRGAGTNSDGVAAGTFGDKQTDDFKSHTHLYTIPNAPNNLFDQSYNANQGVPGRTANTATGATGGTETRPRNIAMLYCIKF